MDKPAVFDDTGDAQSQLSLCGFRRWTPKWMQIFNRMTVFIICYVALCVIYGMSHSYTSSMIPSMEKRFGFTSKSIGVVLAMNDVSHVVMALITAHFGGSGHRPRWISLGCFLLGASLLLHASPEIIFPLKTSSSLTSIISSDENEIFCSKKSRNLLNASSLLTEACTDPASNIGPLVIFGVAHFLLGVGATTLMILGLPFIDDNSDKKNAPIFFAISFSGRIFGPVLGFGLGAYCNSIFLDWSDPGFQQTDPRWISAWYLGYLFTGMGLCVFALTMGCFPASIPRSTAKSETDTDAKSLESPKKSSPARVSEKAVSWQDLPGNVKRLLTNGAFMFRALSNMLDGLIISGYMSFLPKFIGQQFHVSQSAASLAGGMPSVFAVAVGVICGGFLIRRFKLQPRHIGMALTVAAVVMAAAFYAAIGLGCETTEIYGFGSAEQSLAERSELTTSETSVCPSAKACGCPETEFRPVCNPVSGTSYYSPCHAGCRSSIRINQTKYYRDCSCVNWNKSSSHDFSTNGHFDNSSLLQSHSLFDGLCPKKCTNLYIFVAVMFVAMFVTGLPLSGSIMIQYRVVDLDLKSLATGVSALLMSAFGFLPAPILTGIIVDSTCLLWQVKSCGERGFCLLYDVDELRWKLHLTVGTIKVIAALLDMVVTYKVWNLKFEEKDASVGLTSANHSRPSSPATVLSVVGPFSHNSLVPPALDDRLDGILNDEEEDTSKV